MNLVVDENVDFLIVKSLREKAFRVSSILEQYPGITDTEVLEIANNNDSLLITEDKDFGELTYRLNIEHKGILLIRLGDLPRKQRIGFVVEILESYSQELRNCFSVVNSKGLRIKKRIK